MQIARVSDMAKNVDLLQGAKRAESEKRLSGFKQGLRRVLTVLVYVMLGAAALAVLIALFAL